MKQAFHHDSDKICISTAHVLNTICKISGHSYI